MSRIYEALELSGIELEEKPAASFVRTRQFESASKPFEEKILALYRRIEAVLGPRPGKVVSIAALEPGGHGFTYAYELARLAALQLKRRVLYLGTWQSGCATQVLQNGVARGWEKATFGDEALTEFVHQLEEPPMWISQISLSKESLAGLVASPRFANIMRRMRKRYDLIVVDTPPMSESMDAVLLSPIVDGTVLVVNAGESRWQVVRNAVDQLTAQQGAIIGMVLNKRKHYIPNFIYRKL